MESFDYDRLVAVVRQVELTDADQLELILPGDGRRRHLALERGIGIADDGVSCGYDHPVVRSLLPQASGDADDVHFLGLIVLRPAGHARDHHDEHSESGCSSFHVFNYPITRLPNYAIGLGPYDS